MNIKKKILAISIGPGTCIGNHLAGVFRYYGEKFHVRRSEGCIKGYSGSYTGSL